VTQKQNNQTNYQNDATDTVCSTVCIAIESAISSHQNILLPVEKRMVKRIQMRRSKTNKDGKQCNKTN